jgi:POT family proton-dependent oligopeptide transporter
MAQSKYLTAPVPSEKMPGGVPYIISNEAAERFSYYGMRAILVIFMTRHLMGRNGQLAPMNDAEAKTWYHLFTSAVYFTPLLGAVIADAFLGKYLTIMSLSLVYCAGHLALALDDTRLGLLVGLALIALGSGGIKPCVSAHVGDQFGKTNARLLEKVFGWFYFAINFGAFASTLLTPYLLEHLGPHVAFAVPGILMGIATLAFWMGRWKFVHVPPGGMEFLRETFGPEGRSAMLRLAVIYVFIAMFWSLFDQTGSAWVLQAEQMDRTIFGIELLSSQIQAANPLLIMILIPTFAYGVYPAINKVFPLTPLRKISIGFFVAAASFAVSTFIEMRIAAGGRPSIAWQLLAYVIITCAEVMISITGLEFSYTQAPRRMKSIIMALYMLSVSLGNAFTAGVNHFLQGDQAVFRLSDVGYYSFFTISMLATAVVFIVVALLYKPRTYIQEEQPAHGFPTIRDHS